MDNFDSILNVSAVNTNDKTSVFAAESKENRNHCYDMSEKMTEKIASDSNAFQIFLDVQSRFDRYTANNALLITAQILKHKSLAIMVIGENKVHM